MIEAYSRLVYVFFGMMIGFFGACFCFCLTSERIIDFIDNKNKEGSKDEK